MRYKYLKEGNCSEANFSKLLAVKQSDLKKIESGEKDPSAEVLAKASKILKVSIEHLLDNRIMAEDQLAEGIIFTSQIGSIIHAARSCYINNAKKDEWRQYSLKSVAGKLGISSMELKRIEELNKSKHLENDRFLRKISDLLGLSATYIKALVETSFPRGEEKKLTTSIQGGAVHYVRDGSRIRGLVVSGRDFIKSDLETLKKRIELEVEFMHSKPTKQ